MLKIIKEDFETDLNYTFTVIPFLLPIIWDTYNLIKQYCIGSKYHITTLYVIQLVIFLKIPYREVQFVYFDNRLNKFAQNLKINILEV